MNAPLREWLNQTIVELETGFGIPGSKEPQTFPL